MDFNSNSTKVFLLMVLLISAAYFVGVATDLNGVVNGLVRLWYAGTGRNSQGNFVAYPSGGGNVQLQ